MSNLIAFNPADALTMSSREIAELVESRHDSVKRTIERCSERGVFTLPPMEETSFKGSDGRGQTVSVYKLDKRASLIVVAQLCPEFTAAVVDRWQQLEAQASKVTVLLPNFENPLAAARAWIEAMEQKEAAESAAKLSAQHLALAAPKIEALERIAAGDENLTLTQAAKVLGIKREALTQWMNANGWVYRLNGSWVAYDAQIRTGRLVYKEARYTDEKTNQLTFRPYCHITPKGIAWLAENGPKTEAA